MKFRSYLTEAEESPLTLKPAQVKQYIDLLDDHQPLERASDTKPNRWFEYKDMTIYYRLVTLKTDRKPLGFFSGGIRNQRAWKALNELLEKNGHVRRDACTMAVKDVEALMDNFGKAYYVIPIGKFKYSWVNSHDFNYEMGSWLPDELKELLVSFEDEEPDPNNIKKAEEMINANIFTNKGFSSAYAANREIWMNPKTYYMIERTRDALSWWVDFTS